MLTKPGHPAAAARTLIIGGMLLIPTGPARAQSGMSGGGRSLGGYGAATIGRYYSSGTTAYMPYSGGGGYVPYQGGPGGGFAVRPVSRALPQTPIGGTSMAATPIGGASLGAGAMTDRSGTRRFESFRFSSGLGSDMIGRPMTQPSGLRRGLTGPGFGYPFRVPPDLVNGSGGSSPSM
ncbi:MAG: hypothetical protein ACYC61_18630 [Isosphaeraceae bacterium]